MTTIADWLQLATVVSGAVGVVATMVNRTAVANHQDRLATLTSGAANAAGRIRDALNDLPAGADIQTVKAKAIEEAATVVMQNYSGTIAKLGATTTQVVSTIIGQLGQIPVAPVPVIVAPAVLPAPTGAYTGDPDPTKIAPVIGPAKSWP